MVEIGDVISGRYRLVRCIGTGGMGTVWEALDLTLGQSVALKRVMFPDLGPDAVAASKARTMREARTAARLRGEPTIISIYDVLEDDGKAVWLVMEYLPSRSLSDILADRPRLDIAETARIGADVARALAAAHANEIVHRDIKPGNVLIADRDGRVKLTDFGISHAPGEDKLTASNVVSGTPPYMSPEVAAGYEATAASDIFSLGSTLYRLVEGAPPYGEGGNPLRLLFLVASSPPRPPQAAGSLTPVLHWLLDPDPGRRPDASTAADRLDELVATLRGNRAAPTVSGPAPTVTQSPATPAAQSAPSAFSAPEARRGAAPEAPPLSLPSAPSPARPPERAVPPLMPPSLSMPPPGAGPAGPPERRGWRRPVVALSGLVALAVLAVVVVVAVQTSSTATPGQQAGPTTGAASGADVPVAADAVALTASVSRNPLPAGMPGTGKPAVVIGSKNFAEQTVLGELYSQALKAKGYNVTLKESIGGSELIDRSLQANQIQMFPEYLGETVTSVAKLPAPASASDTYTTAKQWLEANRQATVLLQTPFQDTDAVVVTTGLARQYGLQTVADLSKIGSGGQGVTLAGPAEFANRETGLPGMKRAYNLPNVGYLPVPAGSQYAALDQGVAQAANAFSTDYQLASDKYTLLTDPDGVFGYQYVAPIVKQDVISAQGPEFSATLNWVSGLLTEKAIQALNQQVQGNNQPAADVAKQFLAANGLQ